MPAEEFRRRFLCHVLPSGFQRSRRYGLLANRSKQDNLARCQELLAGGGIKGGHVHGAAADLGFQAVDKPVHVHDLHATILHLLGFDHEKLMYRYAGRDFRLTDVHGKVVREVLA